MHMLEASKSRTERRMHKAYNPDMQRNANILRSRLLLGVVVCSALLACKAPGDPAKAVKQYRAWCFSESKPLGDWHLDRAAAEVDLKKHLGMRAHHSASIKIWTGDPAITGAQ